MRRIARISQRLVQFLQKTLAVRAKRSSDGSDFRKAVAVCGNNGHPVLILLRRVFARRVLFDMQMEDGLLFSGCESRMLANVTRGHDVLSDVKIGRLAHVDDVVEAKLHVVLPSW